MDTRAELRQFIFQDILGAEKGEPISDSGNLLENGLDSLGILRLTVFIEEKFGTPVPDEAVVPENIQSIDALVRFVESLR